MTQFIKTGLDVAVKLVNAIPVLKGYRTIILVGGIFILTILDLVGVGPGNLYQSYSDYLYGAGLLTALAHNNNVTNR